VAMLGSAQSLSRPTVKTMPAAPRLRSSKNCAMRSHPRQKT